MRLALCLLLLLPAGAHASEEPPAWNADPYIHESEQAYFGHLRQLTFEGENAEGYWADDNTHLVFQRTPPATGDETFCDQIYSVNADGTDLALVSTGTGRTTCAWRIPGSADVLYASTHGADPACPPSPDYSRGYVWPVYASYDIYRVTPGSEEAPVTVVRNEDYDAEGTMDRAGRQLVYTSLREGDLDIYVRDLETSAEYRLTDRPGYDGGAVFSPDGTQIAWRAHYPEGEELADYQALLAEHLIRPGALDLWIANADGTEARQVTDNGAANFAPWFTPDGQSLIFSSNMANPEGREFDLYLVSLESLAVTQVTHTAGFDGFPMFSVDGKYLAFCSNRNESHEGNTNLFIAEWAPSREVGL